MADSRITSANENSLSELKGSHGIVGRVRGGAGLPRPYSSKALTTADHPDLGW